MPGSAGTCSKAVGTVVRNTGESCGSMTSSTSQAAGSMLWFPVHLACCLVYPSSLQPTFRRARVLLAPALQSPRQQALESFVLCNHQTGCTARPPHTSGQNAFMQAVPERVLLANEAMRVGAGHRHLLHGRQRFKHCCGAQDSKGGGMAIDVGHAAPITAACGLRRLARHRHRAGMSRAPRCLIGSRCWLQSMNASRQFGQSYMAVCFQNHCKTMCNRHTPHWQPHSWWWSPRSRVTVH